MALNVLDSNGIFKIGTGGTLQTSSPTGKERIRRRTTLSMRWSELFWNAVSKRSGITALSNVEERRPGGSSVAPVCLFDGLFGGNRTRKDLTTAPSEPKFEYHDDVPLPFPASLLSNTFLAGKELRCCYKATVDGFSAMMFHKRCDFKGPCAIVGTTSEGLRIGAFNPEGYRSTDDYYDSFDAFLFYWPPPSSSNDAAAATGEFPPSSPIVLPKVGGSGAALFDYARGGPQFGADGLLIGPPLSPVMGGLSGPETDSDQGQGQLSEARSRLGLSYAKRPDGKESLFGDERTAILVEIEVFCSPAIAKLYQ